MRRLPVDLGVRQWYQKQAVRWEFFLILGRGLRFCAERFTPVGMDAMRGACRKLDYR
jgi:hypothetical protein